MKYEKPQKGNPHELTIKQHIFPAASIERFTNESRNVAVFLREQNKEISVKSDNKIFCAMRSWDQRSEMGFMKEIEDKYQALAEDIISGVIDNISKELQGIITDMFAVWNIRYHQKKNPIPDYKIENAIDVARHYTKDDEEVLEKHGITVIRPDLTLSGRSNTGSIVQLNLFNVRKQMVDAQWGILIAKEGEFIVPDNYSNASVLPLTPSMCLFSQSENSEIPVEKVASINKLAIESSDDYYFANDLSKCPIYQGV